MIVHVDAPTGNTATDTAAVQRAFNGGGNYILFPEDATYRINSTILYSSFTKVNGNNSLLIAEDNLSDNIFQPRFVNYPTPDVYFENLRFNGNAANQSHSANPVHAIAFYNVKSGGVFNCSFEDMELDGVYVGVSGNVDGTTSGGGSEGITVRGSTFTECKRNAISVTRGQFVVIEDCTFVDNNIGVLDNARYDAATVDFEPNPSDIVQYGVVRNSSFTSHYAPSVAIARAGVTKSHFHFHDNTFEQFIDYAILGFNSIDDVLIERNVINTEATGIWFNGQGDTVSNLIIRDNEINGADVVFLTGIGLNYNLNDLIENNHITDFARAVGLFIESTNVQVLNNVFTSCATAIDITGNQSNVTQSGNVIN